MFAFKINLLFIPFLCANDSDIQEFQYDKVVEATVPKACDLEVVTFDLAQKWNLQKERKFGVMWCAKLCSTESECTAFRETGENCHMASCFNINHRGSGSNNAAYYVKKTKSSAVSYTLLCGSYTYQNAIKACEMIGANLTAPRTRKQFDAATAYQRKVMEAMPECRTPHDRPRTWTNLRKASPSSELITTPKGEIVEGVMLSETPDEEQYVMTLDTAETVGRLYDYSAVERCPALCQWND